MIRDTKRQKNTEEFVRLLVCLEPAEFLGVAKLVGVSLCDLGNDGVVDGVGESGTESSETQTSTSIAATAPTTMMTDEPDGTSTAADPKSDRIDPNKTLKDGNVLVEETIQAFYRIPKNKQRELLKILRPLGKSRKRGRK